MAFSPQLGARTFAAPYRIASRSQDRLAASLGNPIARDAMRGRGAGVSHRAGCIASADQYRVFHSRSVAGRGARGYVDGTSGYDMTAADVPTPVGRAAAEAGAT